jgi:hypothetical protein
MDKETHEELLRKAHEYEENERRKIFDLHYLYLQKLDKLTDKERACFVRALTKIVPSIPIIIG